MLPENRGFGHQWRSGTTGRLVASSIKQRMTLLKFGDHCSGCMPTGGTRVLHVCHREDGLVVADLRASEDFIVFPRGSRPAVLHCAHGTSTFSSCAFCEQEGLSGGSLPSSLLVFLSTRWLYFHAMSIRKAAGEWEPMLLGIEPRTCKVCRQGLYRDKTIFRGGWSRCTVCDEFVHYSCLASGKVSFLKARPRICKTCRAAEEHAKQAVLPSSSHPAPVGS